MASFLILHPLFPSEENAKLLEIQIHDWINKLTLESYRLGNFFDSFHESELAVIGDIFNGILNDEELSVKCQNHTVLITTLLEFASGFDYFISLEPLGIHCSHMKFLEDFGRLTHKLIVPNH